MLILFHGRRLNTFLRGFYCTDCCEVVTVHCRVGEGVWSWFTLNDEHERKERHMVQCRSKHLRDGIAPSGAAPDTASRPTAPDKEVRA